MTIIVLAVGVGIVALAVFYFNRLVGLRNRGESAWSDIDVQLKRRHELVPNLVETVKGYAAHEKRTLEDVVAARSRAVQAAGLAAGGAAGGAAAGGGPAGGTAARAAAEGD